MNQLIYKISFVSLILSLVSAKIEVSLATGILSILISLNSKTSLSLVKLISILLLINLIGFLGLFRSDTTIGVYLKDFIYFLRPIIIVFASYSLIKRIKNKAFLFESIIILSFLFAIWHIFKLTINISKIERIAIARAIGGRYSHLELVGLLFFILIKDNKIKHYVGNFIYKFMFLCVSISFILYFSRVMIGVLILFILAYKGYFRLTKKGIKIIFLGTLFFSVFTLTINKFDVDSNSKGFGGFIFKIQNSYKEIFGTLDIETIKRDKRDLWKHWRGYEAQTAIKMINDDGFVSWGIGKGFGALVDLGVNVKLSGENVRYIPILHNGFVYVLFKTGLLGLLLYLFYIFYLYSFYRNKTDDEELFKLNRLLVGSSFYILFSSLVVTGIFKPYDFSSLLIGSIFALKLFYIENRNIRNQRDTKLSWRF